MKRTLSILFAILVVAGLVGCQRGILDGTVGAEEAPPGVDSEQAAALDELSGRSQQLEAERAQIAAEQAELASRAAELADQASRLAAEQDALAERQREVRRREQQADRRFDELESRIRELERTPVPAAPAPAPPVAEMPRPAEPRVQRLTLPEGTILAVELIDPLSSRESQAGETFRASITRDVLVDGRVAVPSGSLVLGRVVDVVRAKAIGGQARLVLAFTHLEPRNGGSTDIDAEFRLAGRKTTKRDAATIGGAAAAGAILGRVIDGEDKGGVVGAIIGAAAGTAVAAKDRDDVVLPVGTGFDLELLHAVEIVRGET